MDCEVIKTEVKLCSCCMEEHEVKTVLVTDCVTFKNKKVYHPAEYYYCENADEFYADEEQLSKNDSRMKDAYRKSAGLLTSDEIGRIRAKYGISQSDLCALLDWGGKTVARYENHQVQDKAHDSILRKLDVDPAWFLDLLNKSKDSLSEVSYQKYLAAGKRAYEESRDQYLRKAIEGEYAGIPSAPVNDCNCELNLDKVVDVVAFFANSQFVRSLYKVKLMKLMWYADALSYKRTEQTITGLVYTKMPLGALPLAHDSIIDLKGISYEEIDFGEGTGYHFTKCGNKSYPHLTEAEKEILNTVAKKLGTLSKEALVQYMHKERAYTETAPRDIIQFKYSKDLSIS